MPARPSREASAEPVAPHPTITARAWISLRCPPAPIPGNNTCREYRSSSSKEVTSFDHANLYYRCRPIVQRNTTWPDTGSSNQLTAEIRVEEPGCFSGEYCAQLSPHWRLRLQPWGRDLPLERKARNKPLRTPPKLKKTHPR